MSLAKGISFSCDAGMVVPLFRGMESMAGCIDSWLELGVAEEDIVSNNNVIESRRKWVCDLCSMWDGFWSIKGRGFIGIWEFDG